MKLRKNILFNLKSLIVLSVILIAVMHSCSSIDFYTRPNSINENYINSIDLLTYNIKAIYEKEEADIDSLMKYVNDNNFDFVLFQELFDESTRDNIIEQADENFYRSIIARVDYSTFPSFIFQDAGLFMMSRFPVIDLSDIEFEGDIDESNGIIHMMLEKEISKTNDFLANKSVVGSLFSVNDSSKIFLFGTHVQAIGSREHKDLQLTQIRDFIDEAVSRVIAEGIVSESKNLTVILAGDFNSNAYSYSRFQNMRRLLGNPDDLHMAANENKHEYTFRFRNRAPSRRFDYIFAYPRINGHSLNNINPTKSSAYDVKGKESKSISDHKGLSAEFFLN